MQAWQVIKHGEPKEVMELGEKAVPEPGPGEIRILVKAVALGLPGWYANLLKKVLLPSLIQSCQAWFCPQRENPLLTMTVIALKLKMDVLQRFVRTSQMRN